ncbi:MAG: 50S ribosomal protein L16 [Parcubacteria group bacterium CG10_big_fil_rev_8_21_14_0_10_38_31]|nr:MAG: 50S ribosomal protein L16 [Parcubacteria group bacterium CG10_big_fil_rev_8_21_14_0_10_38_31]
MLFPKKVKFRKWQTKRRNLKKARIATRGATVAFGSFGLKAEKIGRITSNQIEAARKVASKSVGKTGRIWIRIFPDRPYTAKPAEMGMGKGKGDPSGYVAEVKPGTVIFEIDGVSDAEAKEALRKAGAKISVKTKVISR